VPLSTVAFATLDARFRTDAASLFSLVRNIGSSIGISIVTVLLTRNVQVNHASCRPASTRSTRTLRAMSPAAAQGDPSALSRIDQLVNQQALMISYVDDFKLMMIVTLAPSRWRCCCASRRRTRIVATVPGLGRLMSPASSMKSGIECLSRFLVDRAVRVIARRKDVRFTFETASDHATWVGGGMVPSAKAMVISGAGVDRENSIHAGRGRTGSHCGCCSPRAC
jgi:hypothetical protein